MVESIHIWINTQYLNKYIRVQWQSFSHGRHSAHTGESKKGCHVLKLWAWRSQDKCKIYWHPNCVLRHQVRSWTHPVSSAPAAFIEWIVLHVSSCREVSFLLMPKYFQYLIYWQWFLRFPNETRMKMKCSLGLIPWITMNKKKNTKKTKYKELWNYELWFSVHKEEFKTSSFTQDQRLFI